MYDLIIAEKPAAAKKIAEALADGKVTKVAEKGVPYFKLTRNSKSIVVGASVGHLFGLAEKDKKGFTYPVFDIEWVPIYTSSKESAFSKKYYDVLVKLCKEADDCIVACDFDIEGEVIGHNIIHFICKRKDAKRMKFSTLTKQDLEKSFSDVSAHLDWGLANAGETRHYLDYFYGINLSRALTTAIKKAGMFKILSTGRVQGPALKIIVDKEKEIKAFIPKPFWQIILTGKIKANDINANHKADKIWEKEKALVIYDKIKREKQGKIISVEKNRFSQSPPIPFDLTSLQTESYRCFGINPKATLEVAQDLYTNGFISYPRTSSQQLPAGIGFSGIIKNLGKKEEYKELASKLLKKSPLKPNNGKKTDPAHPAIYPTGILPGELEPRSQKVYDLIVKRFFATFADPAIRETVVFEIDVKEEIFITKGTRTVEKNWHVFYAPYIKLEEIELPEVKQGDIVDVKKIIMEELETQPPKRYTPSSIIRELEKRNLGTKATRAEIIDTLYKRHYIAGESIAATELGIKTIEILLNYAPKIVDEELTRHFETDMEEIRREKKKKDFVIDEAKNILKEILHEFQHKEKEVGEALKKTYSETRIALETVGKCVKCGEGSLVIKRSKLGKFVACDRYPDCKAFFRFPSVGKVILSEDTCTHCQHPVVKIIKAGKRPQEVCINPDCKSKAVAVEESKEAKPCPTCKEGNLIVRKGIYGAFYGCSRYPKCKHTEPLKKNENKPVK